jgi:protein-S-isoprenylcysteine O-methyltransferase Ste14
VTPLPDSDTAAAIVFYGLVAVFVLLEQRVRLRSFLDRTGERRDSGSLQLVILCVVVGLVSAFALASHAQGAAITVVRWPLFICGVALMAAGIVVRQWSVALLGSSFTVDVRVHQGQQVIDHGPYRFVRHPSYSGLLLTLAGIGLALDNWLSIICAVVVPAVGIVVRIRVEERALFDGLGEPYRRFAEGRARLVPHVW